MDVINLSMAQYELLKCGGCGRNLGYICIDVKMFPPKSLIRLVAGGPSVKIEKMSYVRNVLSGYKEQTRKRHQH